MAVLTYLYALNFSNMEYNKLISVTGMGGLFELVGSKADGAIVRSLEDKTTKFISSRVHQFSHLESIEVYTVKDNVNLVEVFKAMKDSGEKLPDYKDAKVVKSYFEKVYPDMDFERVYASDMKKMVRWYNIFQDNDIDFEKAAEAAEEEIVEENTPEETEEKPVEKKPKKAAAKASAEGEEPKKKAPAKKPAKTKKEE